MEKLPNELGNIIRNYIIFKPKNKEELQNAVNLWCENKDEALNYYDHISDAIKSIVIICLLYKKSKKYSLFG